MVNNTLHALIDRACVHTVYIIVLIDNVYVNDFHMSEIINGTVEGNNVQCWW